MNFKGQSSFELVLIIVSVIILSLIVLSSGINSFGQLNAILIFHSEFNSYVVKESYNPEIVKFDFDFPNPESIVITIKSKNDLIEFDSYKDAIERNIKDKTKYTSVVINSQVVN